MRDQENDICAKGAFNLIAHTIASCFNQKKGEKKINRKFSDSHIVKAFCDCSDNFDHEKLKKEILKANK
jgi:hypothetical protein